MGGKKNARCLRTIDCLSSLPPPPPPPGNIYIYIYACKNTEEYRKKFILICFNLCFVLTFDIW